MSRYDRIRREMQSLHETTRGQLNKQDRLFRLLRFVTPAAVTERLIYDVTGAGPGRNRQFDEDIERVRRERQLFIWQQELDDVKMSPKDYDRIPRYAFTEKPLRAVLVSASGPLLVILLATAILVAMAIGRVRKYPGMTEVERRPS
jgi:hypothetical protein